MTHDIRRSAARATSYCARPVLRAIVLALVLAGSLSCSGEANRSIGGSSCDQTFAVQSVVSQARSIQTSNSVDLEAYLKARRDAVAAAVAGIGAPSFAVEFVQMDQAVWSAIQNQADTRGLGELARLRDSSDAYSLEEYVLRSGLLAPDGAPFNYADWSARGSQLLRSLALECDPSLLPSEPFRQTKAELTRGDWQLMGSTMPDKISALRFIGSDGRLVERKSNDTRDRFGLVSSSSGGWMAAEIYRNNVSRVAISRDSFETWNDLTGPGGGPARCPEWLIEGDDLIFRYRASASRWAIGSFDPVSSAVEILRETGPARSVDCVTGAGGGDLVLTINGDEGFRVLSSAPSNQEGISGTLLVSMDRCDLTRPRVRSGDGAVAFIATCLDLSKSGAWILELGESVPRQVSIGPVADIAWQHGGRHLAVSVPVLPERPRFGGTWIVDPDTAMAQRVSDEPLQSLAWLSPGTPRAS